MSNIQIFNYQSNEVRTVEMGGEPWFVLKDVCNILGVVNDRNVAARLDEDEKGVCQMDTLTVTRKANCFPERTRTAACSRSRKPRTTRPNGVACRRLSLPKAERRSGCCTCN